SAADHPRPTAEAAAPRAGACGRRRARCREHGKIAFRDAAYHLGRGVVRDAEHHVGVDGLAALQDLQVTLSVRRADGEVWYGEDVLPARDDHGRGAGHAWLHLRVRKVD